MVVWMIREMKYYEIKWYCYVLVRERYMVVERREDTDLE